MITQIVRARDVMTQNYVMTDGLVTVQKGIELLQEHQSKMLLIQKRHDNDEYGLVLLADIAKEVIAKNRSPDRVNLYEIMAKPVLSVPPDMDVRYCARLFESFGINRAPVIADGKVLGTVSYNDIVLKGCIKEMYPPEQPY